MHCNGIPLPGSVPGANATREPSVVLAVDTKEAPTADAPTQCTTPRTTASRVASFLAERDAARDLVYDAVLARAGYIIVAGIIPTLLAMALDPFNLLDNAMFYYVFSVGYITAGCGVTLMTTLPLADFDCTCVICVAQQAACTPHISSPSAKRTQSSRSDTMSSTGSGGGSVGPSLLVTEEDAASLSSPQTIGRVSEGIETPIT